MNRFSFLELLDGAPATTPRPIEKQKLLNAAAITDRQLKYFIRCGAVSRPLGVTKAATYTSEHLAQIRRVVNLVKTKGLTVLQVAEFSAQGRKGIRAKRESPTLRPSRSTQETVYRLSEGLRVVAAGELLPSEHALLKRLLKAGETSLKERAKLASEVMTRNHRLK